MSDPVEKIASFPAPPPRPRGLRRPANGRGQARQNNNVKKKEPTKWSNSKPSPERGVHFAGPRAKTTSATKAATLQTFNMSLTVIPSGAYRPPPPFACESWYGYQEEYAFSNDEGQ
jgi:hypothetical protein